MTMTQAIEVLGLSRSEHELRNTLVALSLSPLLNTAIEHERRMACAYVLRRMSAYRAACQAIRDARK